MRRKTWVARIVVPSILLLTSNVWAAEPDKYLTNAELMPNPRSMATAPMRSLHIEIAGADDTGQATDEELKDAGTNMVPSEDLKKAKPVMQPSAEKMVEKPKKLEVMPVKSDTPDKGKMAKEMQEEPMAEPMSMESAMAGPYLRLDAGYAINHDSDGTQAAGEFTSETVGDASVWGGGIGYRFDQNLRSDVTFSYRPDADVSATTSAGNTASTEVNALSVMVNAYWDFAPIDKITPYLGAGIGMAHLDTSDQTTTGGVATESGSTSDNFAWSLMAGAAYQIIDNTSLDINYRFINLGEFGQDVSTSYDDLMSHEIRAGLRVGF